MSPVTHRGRRRLDRDRPVERLRGLLDDDLAASAPVQPPAEPRGDPAVEPAPGLAVDGPPGAPERIEPPEEQTGAPPVRLRLPWVSLLIAGLVLGLVVLSLLTRGPGEQEVLGAAATDPSAQAAATDAAAGGSDPEGPAGAAGAALPVAGPTAAPSGSTPGAGTAPAQDAAPATGPLTVHVVGEVQRPGVVEVPAGSRVGDAVEAAGGLRDTAVVDAVNLAAPAADGMQIVIPDQARAEAGPPAGPPAPGSGAQAGSPARPGTGAGTDAPGSAGAAPPGGAAGAGLLDLNTATVAQLEELPEVGPVLAQRIIDHREQIGGFRAVEELDDVSGIGPAMMEALVPLVAV